MLFQTPEFLVLMISVIVAMILVRTHSLQLIVLLLASWVFYMSWNPIFIFLILFVTLVNYWSGLAFERYPGPRQKKILLIVSCAINLGLLAVFKYFNFFTGNVNEALNLMGCHSLLPAIEITLPVGISFYTFHSMSYTLDVYRGEMPAEKSFIRFALFVAMFTQLVAGPILRGTQFMPQLHKLIILRDNNLRSGFNLFLVGLFKKVVVADNVSKLADYTLGAPQGLPSLFIIAGTVAFGLQIYCDFSGYTDMAIGCGRMLGLKILPNFNYPYFSRSLTEFWRRWHISLSSWLRDYLYIGMGGSRHGTWRTYRNLLITMSLCGLWHGASWNFVLWGTFHGIILALERVLGIGGDKSKLAEAPQALAPAPWKGALGLFKNAGGWVVSQYLVFLGWLMFRVQNTPDLLYCLKKFILFDFNFRVTSLGIGKVNPISVGIILIGFLAVHTFSWRAGGLANLMDRLPRPLTGAIYVAAVFMLIWLWPSQQMAFIYFQF